MRTVDEAMEELKEILASYESVSIQFPDAKEIRPGVFNASLANENCDDVRFEMDHDEVEYNVYSKTYHAVPYLKIGTAEIRSLPSHFWIAYIPGFYGREPEEERYIETEVNPKFEYEMNLAGISSWIISRCKEFIRNDLLTQEQAEEWDQKKSTQTTTPAETD